MSIIERLFQFNVLNEDPGTGVLWTRVNVGEAIPGTVTPLTAEFHRPANHYPPGRMFLRMGLVRKATTLKSRGAYIVSFLCGKLATNVDVLRWLMDRTPGTSGDEFEQSILGSVRQGVHSKPDRSRYPIALIKLVWLIYVLPSENRKLGYEIHKWWRDRIDELGRADAGRATQIFTEAREKYETIIDHTGLVAAFSPAVLSQLSRPVCKIGSEEDLLTICAGYGNIKETDMLEKLWSVAKGIRTLEQFIREYGYMCPSGAELASRSWREDPEALTAILNANRDADASDSPGNKLARTADRVQNRKNELLKKATLFQRLDLKIGFWLTNRILPIREVGKSCMFMAPDVGRAAARVIGRELADCGDLTAAEDVFYLSYDELVAAIMPPSDLKTTVIERKELRAAYEQIELPDFFTSEDLGKIIRNYVQSGGSSDVDSVPGLHESPDCERPKLVTGAPASSGCVTGTARVIHDPRDLGDFKKGEILVCEITDPGWAALFSIAGAMVVDVGGMLSHSAIIAREMGIPAVVNTRNGTKVIPDGAMVTIDGAAGTVILHDT